MPVYVRRCLQCHQSAEHFAHASQCDLIRCPACGGETETDPAQYATQSTHGDEIHGTRERIWDVTIHPDEVDDVRREFAGTGCDVRVGADGVGRVFAPTKTAKANWFKREKAIAEAAKASEPAKNASNE